MDEAFVAVKEPVNVSLLISVNSVSSAPVQKSALPLTVMLTENVPTAL